MYRWTKIIKIHQLINIRNSRTIFYVFYLQPIELYSGPSPPEGLVCEATGLVLTLCICETYFAKWGGTYLHFANHNRSDGVSQKRMVCSSPPYFKRFDIYKNLIVWFASIVNLWNSNAFGFTIIFIYVWRWYENIPFKYFRPHRVPFKNLLSVKLIFQVSLPVVGDTLCTEE